MHQDRRESTGQPRVTYRGLRIGGGCAGAHRMVVWSPGLGWWSLVYAAAGVRGLPQWDTGKDGAWLGGCAVARSDWRGRVGWAYMVSALGLLGG